MKYLKKFNESLTDIEYVEILLAEINDYYSMNLSVFEKQDSILIKVEKNKSQDEYIDVNLVMDKTIQALSQLSNYEIGTIELYGDGKSYKLSKNNNLSNKKLARVQGFSGSDNLRNLDKYSESDYLMIYIYLVKKEENFITKITKKLFENT